MAQTWNKDTIEHLLQTNDKAVERALIVLFDRQTTDEKRQHTTKHHNNRGFCSYDAEYLTKLAEQIRAGRHLSQNQLNLLRKRGKRGTSSRIGKYHRQLMEEIQSRNPTQQAA